MFNEKELCGKIKSIYPEIGACGIDVNVGFNKNENTWDVDLKRGERHLKTHLDKEDARACMEGKECVHLGTQIAQLKSNI